MKSSWESSASIMLCSPKNVPKGARWCSSAAACTAKRKIRSQYPGGSDMATQTEEVIDCGVGREPSEQELFLIGLGDELIRRDLPFLNEVLRQLVTLSTALAGGAIAILNNTRVGFRGEIVGAIACFLVALVVALWGMLPKSGEITRRAPTM